MERNAYRELGVSKGADKSTVKRAYLKLMREYHPDLHPDDPEASEKCRIINMAYNAIKNGQDTFLYTETDSKKKDSNRDRKRTSNRYGYSYSYGNIKIRVINVINDLLFLSYDEKKILISRIKKTVKISIINDILGLAERLNYEREEKRNQIISLINGLELLHQTEKNTYVSQLNSTYDMNIIYLIWEEASQLNTQRMTMKQDAIHLIKSVYKYLDYSSRERYISLITNATDLDLIHQLVVSARKEDAIYMIKSVYDFLDDSAKERYISLVTNATELDIIHEIVESAREEDAENYNLYLLKKDSIFRIKCLYYLTTSMREEYYSYINNCVNPDEIKRVVAMAYSVSPKYESLVEHVKNKIKKLYKESYAFQGMNMSNLSFNINRCHTIDEVAYYEKALYIVENNYSNSINIINIIDEAISNTDDNHLKIVLDLLKREYSSDFIINDQFEDENDKIFVRKNKVRC